MKKEVQFEMLQALGIRKKEIINSYSLINDSTLIYFLENSMIIKDIQTNVFKQFLREGFFNNILFIDIFDLKTEYPVVTIAEDNKKHIQVSVIHLEDKAKWYDFQIQKLGELVSIKTSHQFKVTYLLFQLSQEEQSLVAYNYIKKKIMGKCNTKFIYRKIEVHPTRQKISLLFGETLLRMYEIKLQNKNFTEKQLLLFSKNEKEEKYIDLCWCMNKKSFYLVVLCVNNQLILFQDEKILKQLKIDLSILSYSTFSLFNQKQGSFDDIFGYNNQDSKEEDQRNFLETSKLVQLQGLENGFLVITENFLICYCKIHHKIKQQQDFLNNNLIYVFQSYLLELNEGEQERLFNITSNKNASQLAITSINKDNVYENYLLQVYQLDSVESPLKKFFQIGLHQSKIEKITAARSKALFITLSEGEARIWSSNPEADDSNYKVLKSKSEEEFYIDISIHPSGFYLAIALFTGFKIYLILDDKLQLIKEVDLVWCSLINYSSRARYLVANEKNNICVFDTIHYNLVFVFKSHLRLIKNFIILDDQYTIISYCNNGDLMMWSIIDKAKINEKVEHEKKEVLLVHKHQTQTQYLSYQYSQKLDLFIATSDDINLVIYIDNCKKLIFKYYDPNCKFSSLQIDEKNGLLYCATNKGTIRIYYLNEWSLEEHDEILEIFNLNFQEIKLSSQPLTNLLLMDTKIIITEMNGTVMCFEIKNSLPEQQTTKNILNVRNNIFEVAEQSFFVQTFKIKEDKNTIRYLKSEIQRLKKVKEIEYNNIEKEFQKVIEMIEKKYLDNLQENKRLHKNFVEKCDDKYKERQIQQDERIRQHEEELKKIQNKTQLLCDYEMKKNQNLIKENEQLKEKQNQELITIEKDHQEKLEQLRKSIELDLQSVDKNYQALLKRFLIYNEQFDKKILAEEEEFEKEIQKYTQLLEEEFRKEKQETEKILNENVKLQKENKTYWKDNLEKQKKVEDLVVSNTKLLEKKVKLCLSLLKMQEQLIEKEQVIQNKMGNIKQSLEVQKSLENFRYILEDKIKNFQQEKDQFMNKIKDKEGFLRELFKDMLDQSTINSSLFKNFQINYKMQDILNKEMKFTEEKYSFAYIKVINFLKQVFQVLNSGNNDVLLRQNVKKMLENFLDYELPKIQNISVEDLCDKKKELELNFDDFDDILKETNQLRKDVLKFSQKIQNQKTNFKHKILIGINKNKHLIEECNKLQEENVYYMKLLSELRTIFRDAQDAQPTIMKGKVLSENISYNNPYVYKREQGRE